MELDFNFAEYKMGAGNKLFTLRGIVVLCKTNEEIKSPDLLIISTNKLRNVL